MCDVFDVGVVCRIFITCVIGVVDVIGVMNTIYGGWFSLSSS